jgi:hypothetical protein
LVFSGVSKHYWKDRKSNAARDFGPHNALPPPTGPGQCPVRRVLGKKLPKLKGPAISGF